VFTLGIAGDVWQFPNAAPGGVEGCRIGGPDGVPGAVVAAQLDAGQPGIVVGDGSADGDRRGIGPVPLMGIVVE